jgi:CRISPR-associated endonuclease Csn1
LEYATCFKEEYVIKYTVDANFEKADKIIDGNIKNILQKRLQKFNNNPKEAFKENWYKDEGLSHPINSVRCFTGLLAVVPIQKDDNGNNIGFVKPGNNHHIAIYSDKDGNKYEHICTFWHAVERKKYGVPIIIGGNEDKSTNAVLDKVLSAGEYPQDFLEQLPEANLYLELSMQQNEMFVLGMSKEDIESAIANNDYKCISEKLYRVQSLSKNDYRFRHHLETQIINDDNAREGCRFMRIRTIDTLFALNLYKVKIDCLGNIKQ